MSILTYQQWPNNSANPQFIAMKEVLDRAKSFTALDIACDERKINAQSGNGVNLRRWVNPSVEATAGQVPNEGVNPPSRQLTYTDYTGTMGRYVEVFEVSRYNQDLHPYDAVKGSVDTGIDLVKSDQERVRWNAAIAGTNVLYNSAAITSRATVNGTITLGRIQTAIRAIRANKGDQFTANEGGQNKVGTSPVEAAYYAFCHTDMETDIRALPGFKTVAEYPSGKGMDYEFGAVLNVRFFTTPELIPFVNAGAATTSLIATGTSGTSSGSADVYPIVIVAKHAMTSVRVTGAGKNGTGNIKPEVLDKADKSDPSNERIYIAFSWYDLCMRTAEEWMYRIEVGATRNP